MYDPSEFRDTMRGYELSNFGSGLEIYFASQSAGVVHNRAETTDIFQDKYVADGHSSFKAQFTFIRTVDIVQVLEQFKHA